MQLRLTRRAFEDLALVADVYARLPATEFVDTNDVIRSFVELRSQDPKGQERTSLPVTSAPVYNLHHGRHRGLTWHDEDSEVVWLLGVGWHESGSRDDAYAVLKRRDEAGDLMPTEQDYLDLEMTLEESRSFVVQVGEQAPVLLAEARERSGEEVRGVIAGRLGVVVQVEVVIIPCEDESLEEVWVGFEMPPLPGACALPPQPEWIRVVLAAMIPIGGLENLEFGGTFPRVGGSRANEIVVCWRSF